MYSIQIYHGLMTFFLGQSQGDKRDLASTVRIQFATFRARWPACPRWWGTWWMTVELMKRSLCQTPAPQLLETKNTLGLFYGSNRDLSAQIWWFWGQDRNPEQGGDGCIALLGICMQLNDVSIHMKIWMPIPLDMRSLTIASTTRTAGCLRCSMVCQRFVLDKLVQDSPPEEIQKPLKSTNLVEPLGFS